MTARDYAAAAAELGVTESWLREMTPIVPLPHHKFAVGADGRPSTRGRGAVVFTDADMAAIWELFEVRAPGPVAVRNLQRARRRRPA